MNCHSFHEGDTMSFKYEIHLTENIKYLHGKVKSFGRPFHFYVYCVDGLLIDTGPPCAQEAVAMFVKQVKPEKIFITHYHEDHSGNAAFLYEQFGIPIFLNEKTAQRLSNKLTIPLYRRLTWGKPHSKPVISNRVEQEITTKNYRFQIVATPGHSEDHTSLIEQEKGILFSGDLFLAKKLHYTMKEESIPELIQSIDNVLTLPFQSLYCGHAGPVANGKKALQEKRNFLEHLVTQAKKLYNKGHGANKISKMLLPSQKMLYLFSFGEMAPKHLIHSIIVDETKTQAQK